MDKKECIKCKNIANIYFEDGSWWADCLACGFKELLKDKHQRQRINTLPKKYKREVKELDERYEYLMAK